MFEGSKKLWRLAPLWGASLFFMGCASTQAPRENAQALNAAEAAAGQLGLVFIASPKCRSLGYGCGLGGQLGGVDAQRRYLKESARQRETVAVWAGSIFSCEGKGDHRAAASYLASQLKELPIEVVAPSAEDLLLPVKQLKALHETAAKKWVVSNSIAKAGEMLWVKSVDLTAAQGNFRIFNFVWPSRYAAKGKRNGIDSDLKKVEAMLAETPANRVNVLVVSTPNHVWFDEIAKMPKAHLVFDGLSLKNETNGPYFMAGDRIRGSVREGAQAAWVLRVRPEPTFQGFYNEDVGKEVGLSYRFGASPSEVQLSAEKSPGLWDTQGEVARLSALP